MVDCKIRVLLVDDHTLFRKGLAELLEHRGGICVAGMAANGEAALGLLAELKPDVVITDLNMPPHGGVALLRRIRAEDWRGPVLILTVSDAEEDLANAMRAGAQGYLLKDMEPDDVVDAVQRAVRGETVVAPTMTMKLVHLLQGRRAAQRESRCPEKPDGSGARDPGLSGPGTIQQGHRAGAGHQPRYREAARPPHPRQTQPYLARRGGSLRGRAQVGQAARTVVRPGLPVRWRAADPSVRLSIPPQLVVKLDDFADDDQGRGFQLRGLGELRAAWSACPSRCAGRGVVPCWTMAAGQSRGRPCSISFSQSTGRPCRPM